MMKAEARPPRPPRRSPAAGRGSADHRGQRGSVLVYVVWILMLLALFVAGVSSRSIFALSFSERFTEQLKAGYIARAAVPYAVVLLERDESPSVDGLSEEWSNNSSWFHAHRVAEGTFTVIGKGRVGEHRYGLVDEERRLNLNTAPPEVFQRLVQVIAGVEEHEALVIGESIADWRDEDTDERSYGAEGSYYRSLGYDCKDAPFENIEELLLIRGVTPEIYAHMAPYVTVFGGGWVNVNTASESVLRALGMSEVALDGIFFFRSGADGQEGTSDDLWFLSVASIGSDLAALIPQEDLKRILELGEEELLGVSSTAFGMTIEADTGRRNGRAQVACVIDRSGSIQFWSEE